MPINNSKQTKKISQEGLIYALIFVLYVTILVSVFIYATQFLSKTINTALSTPVGSEIEAKYGQLDLVNYLLVANKLNLKKSASLTPITPEIIQPEIVSQGASSTPEIATSSPEVIVTPIPEIIEPVAAVVEVAEIRPTIVVNNSTTKSGLAAQLKNKLTAASYQVIRTGTIKPVAANTIIKTKISLDPDSAYLSEIKKIVATNYDFTLENLSGDANYDIEIIIGSK
jgi:hypothetical protein